MSEEVKTPEFDAWEAYKKAPRYVVGIEKELNCFKDFHETNSLSEAEERAEATAKQKNKRTIVYDRHGFPSIPYRGEPEVKEVAPEQSEPSAKKKIKRNFV